MEDETNALAFERVGEPSGIEVIDRIEQQRYSVRTPEPVELREISTDEFHFPVSDAVEFTTSALTIERIITVFVYDENGNTIGRFDHSGESASFPAGTYTLELSPQIKTYIDVGTAAVEIETSASSTTIKFDNPTTIRYGARSHHEHPAAMVTTTAKPADMMAAVETFGSALKTANPERSYPTLRGHPPEIQLGDEFDVPDGLEPPNNGITMELPLDLESIFVAAPLSFYLGASLQPGPAPRILTDDGFEYSLDGPEGFQTRVGNVLRQIFFLDCVTRTEGLYQVPLDERERIEPLVEIDFAELYEQPMAEQLASYLNVPFSVVKEHIQEWPLTTHVEPTAETIEQLPFVVDDLAIIRLNSSSSSTARNQPKAPVGQGDNPLLRSAESQQSIDDKTFVQLGETDTIEQAWIGEDIPIGGSKLTTAAFRNRVDRDITEGDIEISIVVNDDRMDIEGDIVDQAYGDRTDLPFDVSVYRNATVATLREILSQHRGFLHYIGHTESGGFQCSDGKLDANSIEKVGIESFLLNACNSYEQGLALVERGAVGGIVTLADIINQEGVSMGESIARLLNAGFPLRASLTIAREESIQGGQYIVVGDGGMSIAQPNGGVPTLLNANPTGEMIDLEISTYTNDTADIGSICMPHLPQTDRYYLASNHVGEFTLSKDEFAEILEMEEVPIRFDGSLYWSSSISLSDLQG